MDALPDLKPQAPKPRRIKDRGRIFASGAAAVVATVVAVPASSELSPEHDAAAMARTADASTIRTGSFGMAEQVRGDGPPGNWRDEFLRPASS